MQRANYISLLALLSLALSLIAQQEERLDETIVSPDSLSLMLSAEEEGEYRYLEDKHYEHIDDLLGMPSSSRDEYQKMIPRYADRDFNYDEQALDKLSLWHKFRERINRCLSRFFPDVGYWKNSDLFYQLLAVGALVVIVLMVYRLFFTGRRFLVRSDEDPVENEVQFIENNLLAVDLESYIEKAKMQGDFALAIRYLNLLNIQLLAKKQLVVWKKSKTNSELLAEIRDEDVKNDFRRNVDIFNHIWYGRADVDRSKFDDCAASFMDFHNKWR